VPRRTFFNHRAADQARPRRHGPGAGESGAADAGGSSSFVSEALHEEDDKAAGSSAKDDSKEGITSDECSLDGEGVQEAIAQNLLDSESLAQDPSNGESGRCPGRVPIFQNRPTNSVQVSVQAFKGITKDLVFFATRTQYGLTREATVALLRQRRRELVSATP